MFSLLTRGVTVKVHVLLVCVTVPLIVLHVWNVNRIDDCYGPIIFDDAVTFETRGVKDSAVEQRPISQQRRNKTILYWTKMFRSENFYFGDGDIFAGCPVSSCFATNDRSFQSVEDFDAVMFHGPQLNPEDLPKQRSDHQRYVFMDLETQVFHPVHNRDIFNNFFNWTMVYRRDAYIMRPYGFVRNATSNEVLPPHIPAQWKSVSDGVVSDRARNLTAGKTKMAAWFVSHCSTSSKREDLVKILQKHMAVDIYGSCGELRCPRDDDNSCFEMVERDYFFYMSLENSLCRDYITEKVYTALEYNVVPVVYGSADYASFLPPNSYINALDFATLEALAEYLTELREDRERYMSYFKWKSFYRVDQSKSYINCEFCKALHEPNRPRQSVRNIYLWWISGSECRDPPKF